MKLEHKKQKLIGWNEFGVRLLRYLFFTGFLLVFSIGIGVLGYHHFASLNWIDSFHMASMILTGMGPTDVMLSDSAKLFSSFYALYSGIAFLTSTAVFFTPIIHRLLHILHVEAVE